MARSARRTGDLKSSHFFDSVPCVIFNRATRGPSISSTRNSHSPTASVSPDFGKPPNFCVTQPLAEAVD